ncbi:MAG: TIGR01212 family radical SAM protein [Deltaproteobacteria bacterium]|nr:TIGR01212 family radical SAM protein [Deltaproteobacteria bacterium]
MIQPPYRTFSSFLRERFGQRVQKITLDAGLNCPHRDNEKQGGCIYCNARGSGTGAFSRRIGLKMQIETQMDAMARRYKAKAFIAYFQSYSNTYADIHTLKSLYDTILPYSRIVGLAIGTRPDCIDGDKLALIRSYAPDRLVWMEYGLQSARDRTLKLINRGHDAAAFTRAVELTSAFDLRVCAHVIIGLPGEGMDDFLATARLVSCLPVTDIKIHMLYIAKGTRLEHLYREGGYSPMDRESYAQAAACFIAHLREDIIVQRITGDPHEDELVAPLWALDKRQVLDAVHREMGCKHLRQGSRYPAP